MNKNVRVIPAVQARVGGTAKADEAQKLRVAAYCRVSTDNEEQATSYEAQIEHYTSYINANPEWAMAGIFADEGISGTNTKKRADFNRMIDQCLAGKIDMVITKSISRFARNTLDCLRFIRLLKDKGIPVYFEKENINTMDSKGEIMLTIMASLAQQESQSLSQNVKLGIQYRFQQGEVQVNHNRFLGYTKEDKRLVIEPREAEVVKRIFREYLEGASMLQIGRCLEADGILTAAGKQKWRPETLRKILRNEKYIGDALLQKTYTVDFLSKKRVVNNGIVPQYYVENNHDAIIPRELFEQVQVEMAHRERGYSSKYALSGIVFCGECGGIYRRVHWNNRGCKSIVWRCVSRLEEKGKDCGSATMNEEVLQQGVVNAINQMIRDKDTFIAALRENIEAVIGEGEIDARLGKLQAELLWLANSGGAYDTVVGEIDRLWELKGRVADIENKRRRVSEAIEYVDMQDGAILEFDDVLVRKLVERVTIYEGNMVVGFKSGVEVEVKAAEKPTSAEEKA